MSNSLTSMLGNFKAEFKCGVFFANVLFCCLFFKCGVVFFANVVYFCKCGVCWQNMVFSFKENYYENVYTLNVFSLAKTVFDAGLNI